MNRNYEMKMQELTTMERSRQFTTMRCRYFCCTVFVVVTALCPLASSFSVDIRLERAGARGSVSSPFQRLSNHEEFWGRPDLKQFSGITPSSLFASTILPPPAHHMDWLRLQEEQERLLARKHGHREQNQRLQQQCAKIASLPVFANASAKESWATCFTTVEGLREAFGRNRNAVWGDLDASTTRRLYKTLLPRALLELYHCHGVSSEDLAPMAYRARVAAKKYARERSVLPTRIAAAAFDGFRQFLKYGTFQACGMSYRQVWEKYATQIMQEEDFHENEQDFTSRVCYRILQKSCETNKGIDAMFLPDQAHDLHEITRKLEQDVYDLLDRRAGDRSKWAVGRYKILRALLRIRRQMEDLGHCEEKDDDLALRTVLADALVDGCQS